MSSSGLGYIAICIICEGHDHSDHSPSFLHMQHLRALEQACPLSSPLSESLCCWCRRHGRFNIKSSIFMLVHMWTRIDVSIAVHVTVQPALCHLISLVTAQSLRIILERLSMRSCCLDSKLLDIPLGVPFSFPGHLQAWQSRLGAEPELSESEPAE